MTPNQPQPPFPPATPSVPSPVAVFYATPPDTFAPGTEPFIDKPELARRLGRTLRSVDTYMAKGMIPYYKLGRTVAFKWTEVDTHLRTHFRVCQRSL